MDKKARRHKQILDYLDVNGFISIEKMSQQFQVTTRTAGRDLMELEDAGVVRRLHGGGMLATFPIKPQNYRQRRIENAAGKARIGARVAQLVPDGSALFIDTGTTCEAVSSALSTHRDLRVVTYSLRSATVLCENDAISVAVPGGFVRNVDAGVFHYDLVNFISAFRLDTAIISVSGIDARGEMGDDDHGEVQAVREAMKRSAKVILAVDSTKFGRRALVCLGSALEADLIVTDAPPPDDIRALLAGKVPIEIV